MITEKAAKLIARLTERGETIAVAESCTGGMLSSRLTDVAGASQAFLGSVITYSNQLKHRLLHVKISTLEEFGAVSGECAYEMAAGTLLELASDHAISITGVAGPAGGSADKPVGLVFIAVGNRKEINVYQFRFYGDRNEIRRQSCLKAVDLLLAKLPE